jgi:hypothetical protein
MTNTYQIAYGKLLPLHIEKFSKLDNWNETVKACEEPQEIDSRIQNVVNTLLQDEEFKVRWDALKAYYGTAPSIKLSDNAVTCVNERFASFKARTPEGRITVEILRPPIILCSSKLFPALAVLNLVQHVLTLHIMSIDDHVSQIIKSDIVANKVICWANEHKQPGSLLDLQDPADQDIIIRQKLSENIFMDVNFKKGSRSAASVNKKIEAGKIIEQLKNLLYEPKDLEGL